MTKLVDDGFVFIQLVDFKRTERKVTDDEAMKLISTYNMVPLECAYHFYVGFREMEVNGRIVKINTFIELKRKRVAVE